MEAPIQLLKKLYWKRMVLSNLLANVMKWDENIVTQFGDFSVGKLDTLNCTYTKITYFRLDEIICQLCNNWSTILIECGMRCRIQWMWNATLNISYNDKFLDLWNFLHHFFKIQINWVSLLQSQHQTWTLSWPLRDVGSELTWSLRNQIFIIMKSNFPWLLSFLQKYVEKSNW